MLNMVIQQTRTKRKDKGYKHLQWQEPGRPSAPRPPGPSPGQCPCSRREEWSGGTIPWQWMLDPTTVSCFLSPQAGWKADDLAGATIASTSGITVEQPLRKEGSEGTPLSSVPILALFIFRVSSTSPRASLMARAAEKKKILVHS